MQNQIIDIKFKKIKEVLEFQPTLVLGEVNQEKSNVDLKEINLENYNFNFKLSKNKYCTSFPRNESHRSCKFNNLLDGEYLDRCDFCESEFGFRDVFFFGGKPNEMMQEYLAKDHLIYLAYFPGEIIKVGTCSESRADIRQIEQDALYYCFIARIKGSEVQKLENYISEKLRITEYVKSSTKFKVISSKINTESAKEVLANKFKTIKTLTLDTVFKDYLFEKPDFRDLTNNFAIYYPEMKIHKIKKFSEELALVGTFRGLRGNQLLFENNDLLMAVDKRVILGRIIEDYIDAWVYKVGFVDEQIGLF